MEDNNEDIGNIGNAAEDMGSVGNVGGDIGPVKGPVKNQRTSIKCPKCGKQISIFDSNTGEFVCGGCGYVLQDRFEETGPEWRAYTLEEGETKRRTGSPSTLSKHDMGLSTVIGDGYKDATGRTLSSSSRTTINRMKTWDRRSTVHGSTDRNLTIALSELNRLADKLNVSDLVVERAAYTYRKALERGLVRGRSIAGMVSAALYESCRSSGATRTLKDIATSVNMRKKDLAKYYRFLIKEMDLSIPVVDPIKCVSRIASKANLSEKTQRKAFDILNAVKKSGTAAGKDPMGLAASALYLACTLFPLEDHSVTQKDLAEAAGVTEVTIRNRIKGLKQVDLYSI